MVGYIGRSPQIGGYHKLDSITCDGSTAYTMQLDSANFTPESANHLIVSVNGVIQAPVDSFTVSGSTITFASALSSSDTIDFIMALGNTLDIGVPSDGTVTSSKISYPLTTFSSTGIDDNATSTAVTINSSEQVIIGGTTPENSSVVLEAQGATNPIIQVQDTTNNIKCGIQAGDSSAVIRCPQNYPLVFGVGSGEEERMRIDSSGKVAIGSTSPNRQFNVHSTGIPCARFQREQGDNNNRTHIEFIREGSSVGEIQCTNTTTTYATSSDYRLKENVIDLADATTRVKQLQPKRFNFIANADITVDGFLAHEVSSVVPEAITGTHNEVDEEGNPVYQGIDQSKLIPLLTASLQEAIAKIETLETEMTALKARVTTLENA